MGLLDDIKTFIGKYIKSPLGITVAGYLIYKVLSNYLTENFSEDLKVLKKSHNFDLIFDTKNNVYILIDKHNPSKSIEIKDENEAEQKFAQMGENMKEDFTNDVLEQGLMGWINDYKKATSGSLKNQIYANIIKEVDRLNLDKKRILTLMGESISNRIKKLHENVVKKETANMNIIIDAANRWYKQGWPLTRIAHQITKSFNYPVTEKDVSELINFGEKKESFLNLNKLHEKICLKERNTPVEDLAYEIEDLLRAGNRLLTINSIIKKKHPELSDKYIADTILYVRDTM